MSSVTRSGGHGNPCPASPSSSSATTCSSLQQQQQQQQSFSNNSLAIRQEIQRFESVHPSIYAVYDLLDLIPDPLIPQQIREHVVCIEDSFVNSQEWTLSRSVPDLRLGIVGSLSSGKSALVHRYLTGSYMQDESPEGGRFKKEVIIDGQSYLLLIRDEGGPPEMQFSCWVDAVIFVFSLENEASFSAIHSYYTKMSNYRSVLDVPIILIGTQDAISESNPRVIEESRAKKLAADLKRCSYYETCATYGLNVERVFHEACQKIVQSRPSMATINASRPNTPSTGYYRQQPANSLASPNNAIKVTAIPSSPIHQNSFQPIHPATHPSPSPTQYPVASHRTDRAASAVTANNRTTLNLEPGPRPPLRVESKVEGPSKPTDLSSHPARASSPLTHPAKDPKDLPTPSSTPTTARKTKRRSNIFPQLSNKNKNLEEKHKNGELGSGRAIPVRQGYLYKKSIKTLNKDWKKKYVTLTTDGRLTYHSTLHDYMEDVHGKDIPLKHTTVKIPGISKFKFARSSLNNTPNHSDLSSDLNHLSIVGALNGNEKLIPSTNPLLAKDTPNVKKRHRRIKSSNNKNSDGADDSDGYEFTIVSLENKHWHFYVGNVDEREAWVSAIEQQILNSLQGMESDKSRCRSSNAADKATIQAIRTVPGNCHCIDCDTPSPDWASLNLGALICIACSGIHRNLGTHISRVRSLDLDDWPPGHISVMMSLGNSAANKIWEAARTPNRVKPTPNSSREEKERWIRAKYEYKEFLAPMSGSQRVEQELLIEAVTKGDIMAVALILAHQSSSHHVNPTAFYNRDLKTPLHVAATKGNLAVVQLLIWHNADVKAFDAEGKTALFYAKHLGHKDVEDLLKQQGCSEVTMSTNDGSLTRKRGSLSTLSSKSDVLDQLPASDI